MAQQKLSYLNLYTTDPAWNLAAEQYVFDRLPRDRHVFHALAERQCHHHR